MANEPVDLFSMLDQLDPKDNLVPSILGARSPAADLCRADSEPELFRASTLDQLDPADNLMPSAISGGCELNHLMGASSALSPQARQHQALMLASVASSASSPEQQQSMEKNAQREVTDLRRRLQAIVNKELSPSKYPRASKPASQHPGAAVALDGKSATGVGARTDSNAAAEQLPEADADAELVQPVASDSATSPISANLAERATSLSPPQQHAASPQQHAMSPQHHAMSPQQRETAELMKSPGIIPDPASSEKSEVCAKKEAQSSPTKSSQKNKSISLWDAVLVAVSALVIYFILTTLLVRQRLH